jgi:hypothetical protein
LNSIDDAARLVAKEKLGKKATKKAIEQEAKAIIKKKF